MQKKKTSAPQKKKTVNQHFLLIQQRFLPFPQKTLVFQPLCLFQVVWEYFRFCRIHNFMSGKHLISAFVPLLFYGMYTNCPFVITLHPKPFTFPKIVCLFINSGVAPIVKKNWEPLSLGPPLAMATKPRLTKRNRECTSSCQKTIYNS